MNSLVSKSFRCFVCYLLKRDNWPTLAWVSSLQVGGRERGLEGIGVVVLVVLVVVVVVIVAVVVMIVVAAVVVVVVVPYGFPISSILEKCQT